MKECGLIFILEKGLPAPVPLKSVRIIGRVVDFTAQTIVEQKYINAESKPIEAIYAFPVEEGSAVVAFNAELDDGRKITGSVKDKAKAKVEYREAISKGQTAVLLEEEKPDIFQIKIGRLSPGSGITIRLEYISELEIEKDCVRYVVPTTIAPRFIPPTDPGKSEIISSITYSEKSPAPLEIKVEVVMEDPVLKIESPTHEIKVDDKKKTVVLETLTTEMNKDFVLLVKSQREENKPFVFVEEGEIGDSKDSLKSSAVMVSLIPSFKLTDQQQPVELIFLVDRSGSMNGQGILQAKEALEIFIHSMPAECSFNIFSFGSKFDSLFKESVEYNDDTLAKATDHIKKMEANYGGTMIFQPLEAVCKIPKRPKYLRQIFLLTDGQVSNVEEVIDLVRRHRDEGRIFTLGLGPSASRFLVKGIARAGNGTSTFAAMGEDLRPKVLKQLKDAMQPALNEISVKWLKEDGSEIPDPSVTPDDKPEETETKKTLLGYMKIKKSPEAKKRLSLFGQAPRKFPPIFDGTRMVVYRLFEEPEVPVSKVVISANIAAEGPLSAEVDVRPSMQNVNGDFVRKLAARKKIQDLEEDSRLNEKEVAEIVTELGIRYQIASKFTSFVGVDESSKTDYGVMETRVVPQQANLFASPPPMFRSFNAVSVTAIDGPAPMMPMAAECKMARPSARSRMKEMNVMPESLSSGTAEMEMGGSMELDVDEIDGSIPVKKTEKPDEVAEIIKLQSASGKFNWGEPIEKILKKTKEEIGKSFGETFEEAAWITAIAIKILEILFRDEKSLWELVVLKSRKFLAKEIPKKGSEELLSSAEKVIKNYI